MLKWLMGLLCLISSNLVLAQGQAIFLKESKAYRDGDSFVNELVFDRAVSADQVSFEFINKTVQANIKGASIYSGKENISVEDDQVDSVFTYQYQPTLMRSRIIYRDTEASKLEGRVRTEVVGNALKIILDDPKAITTQAEPPIDLDRELDRALRIEASEDSGIENSEAIELMAAAARTQKKKSGDDHIGAASTEDQTPLTKGLTTALTANDAKVDMAKSETEIPLKLDAKKIKQSESSPWNRLFLSFAVVCIVGLGLVVGVKRFAKDKTHVGGNVKVKIVSQHPLGPKKSLAVIHVAGESILIGITDHNISMIKSLALIDDEVQDELAQSFDHQMRQVAQAQTDRYTRTMALGSSTSEAERTALKEDEFSIGNIKDLVSSKLKEMRTL